MNVKELDAAYVAGTYGRFPVTLQSGKGSIAKDETGKTYIDLGSGIAVDSFGYADGEWADVIAKQAHTLQHTSNLYYTEPCAQLAKALCEKSGMKKVFFSNSGCEANECAIKTARKYAQEKYGKDRYWIICLENSFHGRTITTLAATGQDHYHHDFTPLTEGFLFAQVGDVEGIKALTAQYPVAAIMFELVQGEGGVNPLPHDFVTALAEIAKEQDILLVDDEVQIGNGRSGSLYAYQEYGIQPDIVSTAKGLGGGLPIGATLFGEKTEGVLKPGDHGSTFGGNPVVCAGACNIVGRITPALLAGVKAKSAYIFKSLEGAKGVKGVCGLGLMIGIETQRDAGAIVNECLEAGVLVLKAKDKVRLLPALNIPDETLQEAIAIMKTICAKED